MLGGSFEIAIVHADTTITSLPDFLERFLEMQSVQANLTSTQVDHIRAIWINQLNQRQERIDSGTVQSVQNNIVYMNFMGVFIKPEQVGGATVTNPSYVANRPDFNYAEFYTPNYGGFAYSLGSLLYNTVQGQNAYVSAIQGPYAYLGRGNYLIAFVSTDPNASWQQWDQGFVGYAQIPAVPGRADYYLGPWPFSGARYIAIGASNEGGSDSWNDVKADAVGSDVP